MYINIFEIISYCNVLALMKQFFLQTRVLRNDFARYNDDDEEELDSDDNGWKIVHTDVFRFPRHRTLFCAILGKICDACRDGSSCHFHIVYVVGAQFWMK